jgi:hypothetical protein
MLFGEEVPGIRLALTWLIAWRVMDRQDAKERRTRYRIRYPAKARPRLILDGRAFEVIDLCERGVRFLLDEGSTIRVGDLITGSIEFRDGSKTYVHGKVLRKHGPLEVVVTDLRGISMEKMIAEQRYLTRRFPAHGRS